MTVSEVEGKCKELNAIRLMQASSSHTEMTRHEIRSMIVRIFNESIKEGWSYVTEVNQGCIIWERGKNGSVSLTFNST